MRRDIAKVIGLTCALTGAALVTLPAAAQPAPPPPGAMGPGMAPGMAPGMPPGMGPMGMTRGFMKMDADHDGKVTKEEYDKYHDEHFKQMDANGDGVLEANEFMPGRMMHPPMTPPPPPGQPPAATPPAAPAAPAEPEAPAASQ